MNGYYHTLDLAPSATAEEVKAQYERLARIYRPSRFDDEQDREFAERRLLALAEAYRALTQEIGQVTNSAPPRPLVTPGHIDFGTVEAGEKVRRQIQITNEGGDAHSLTYAPGHERSWYRISKITRLKTNAALHERVEIEADSTGMPHDWPHAGWVDVIMDGIVVRVTLELQVRQKRRLPFRARWIATGVVLSMFVLVVLLSLAPRFPPDDRDSLLASSPPLELTFEDQFLLSASVEGKPMLHVSDMQGASLGRLGVVGYDPAFSSAAGQVAFAAPAGNYEQIFVLKPGNNAPRQITSDSTDKFAPQWAPDGRYLAFLAGDDFNRKIRVVTTDGGAVSAVGTTDLGTITDFAWSPDSTQIAVGSDKDGKTRVYIFPLNGGKANALTTFDTWDPAWSPDGSLIAVASARGIYTLSPTGKDLRRLNVQPAHSPVWSSDSEQIAFLSDWTNPPGVADVWRVNRMGGKTEQITDGGSNVVNASWISEGLGIAYVIANRDENLPAAQLWVKPPAEASRFVANISHPGFIWLDSQ